MVWPRRVTALLGAALLAGCTMVGAPGSGSVRSGVRPAVSVPRIQPGSEEEPGFDPSRIPDAVPPAFEAPSRYGNAEQYEVMGRTYRVLESSEGYSEEGDASWYGPDFHGRATSSQETYDMYAMTAAHKSLPIPTYVEVENLDNGRTAVVRVNDRGPFHEGRIIDLSYAAALKLGLVETGTARVRVTAVGPVQTRR